MNEKIVAVVTIGELVKVQTMANGAFRVTFDIPATEAEKAAWLLKESIKTGTLYKFLVEQNDGGNFL